MKIQPSLAFGSTAIGMEKVQVTKSPSICILGGGFSGICAGIKLQTKLGLDDFTIFDENEDFGGTWLRHTFPECASDLANHFYSFSFEPNPYWSQMFCSHSEILTYIKNVSAKHDLYSRTKFRHQIQKLTWVPKLKKWVVHTMQMGTKLISEWMFDMVIAGPGPLQVPNIPEIFRNFKGPLIHPGKWDHSLDLKDKVVAVIGSGATAIQVVPGIVNDVKKLYSFQRRPGYIFFRPQANIPPWMQSIFATVPLLQKIWRWFFFLFFEYVFLSLKKDSFTQWLGEAVCKYNLRRLIPDSPELVEKLTPNYRYGCTHPSASNMFYPALAQAHVEVVREGISTVEDDAIVTKDGKRRPIDVIICATGYKVVSQAFLHPIEITIRQESGQEANVSNFVRKDAQFYLGIVTSPFPNMFVLLGPNSTPLHSSSIFPIECQMDWIVQVIHKMMRDGDVVVKLKPAAEVEYNKNLQRRMKGLAYGGGTGCQSWFVDKESGINNVALGSNLTEFWWATRRVRWEDLEFF